MREQARPSRIRAAAALALLLTLGLLAAASALARPLHPDLEKPSARSAPVAATDPEC